MAKDKFKQMQQKGGGVLTSFQDVVENAKTVAAIEQQASVNRPAQSLSQPSPKSADGAPAATGDIIRREPTRFMRLPNPQIPIAEYNLVTRYCEGFDNMTRQDFVELSIVEKLHKESLMPDEDFESRMAEIRGRLPRGHRKGTKIQTSK